MLLQLTHILAIQGCVVKFSSLLRRVSSKTGHAHHPGIGSVEHVHTRMGLHVSPGVVNPTVLYVIRSCRRPSSVLEVGLAIG